MAVTGRELLGNAIDEFIAGDYSATADTPSGAELIRRADAEPVLRAALSPESLAVALHDAMCRVSHHDRDETQAPCYRTGPYRLIAEYMSPRLLRRAALTTPGATE